MRYEYEAIRVQQMETGSDNLGNHRWSTPEEELVKVANRMGEGGWRLVVAQPNGNYGYRLIFERNRDER